MKLSHVLFRVNDLHKAVAQLIAAGFTVEYGTAPKKAYNAFIWFEEGIFIEIYKGVELPNSAKLLMKLFGYSAMLQRMEKWRNVQHGWCEWSVETETASLNYQRSILKQHHIPFLMYKRAKRIDVNGRKLKWSLIFPKDIYFPFIMSAYVPNPRPHQIIHPNQITKIESIVVGEDQLDQPLLALLAIDRSKVILVKDAVGLQSVIFKNASLKIEDLLV
ncbi:VOC family protein [Pedobacter sp. Hv1]|uniref:VOC family protein n=1 Tax=Pedobacter sp. Hv1 TaxID=1740090 RepID=UPI0006D8D477|nr:VOC family protein [Pedobacter sp. Hv1]KQB98824.1 hypothetical protein AQF98_21005 [Pedobacter sp. Hv1]